MFQVERNIHIFFYIFAIDIEKSVSLTYVHTVSYLNEIEGYDFQMLFFKKSSTEFKHFKGMLQIKNSLVRNLLSTYL